MQASLASGAGGPLWPSVEGRSSGSPSPFAEDCSRAHARARARAHTHTHTHTHTCTGFRGGGVVSPGLFPWGSVWLILHFHFPPFPGTLAETKKSGSHVLFLPGVRAFVEVFASPGQVRRNLPQGPLRPFCHLRPQDSVPPGRDLPSRCAGSPGPGTAGGRAGACLLVKDWAPAGTVEG